MKRLVLVRHGKSSWKYDVADDKRPLKKRGFADGELIANAFKRFQNRSILIWTSPAVRAYETARIFKEKLQVEDQDFILKSQLYTFNQSSLLAQIKTCDSSINELMIFGHNPAMTQVVNSLGDRSFSNIPTTGLTVIDFEAKTWNELGEGKTILNLFPKNLR